MPIGWYATLHCTVIEKEKKLSNRWSSRNIGFSFGKVFTVGRNTLFLPNNGPVLVPH